jgi:acetyl esterase/lipase
LKFSLKAASNIIKQDDVRPLRRRLAVALIQSLSDTLSETQLNGLNLPTSTGIKTFCQKNSLTHSTITIPIKYAEFGIPIPPAILHVIDLTSLGAERENRRSVLYLHGGGYVNSPSPIGQLGMALEMAQAAQVRYLIILEYGLAPQLRYPGQLVQVIAALQVLCASSLANANCHVSATKAIGKDLLAGPRSPLAADLILAGDCAGGHLILSLLAHLKSPSPYAPAITLPRPLRAAVLLSPWVTTTYNAHSYNYNASTDFLTRTNMAYFDEAWKPKQDEVWSDPLAATPYKTFWTDIFQGPDRIVNKTLIAAGTDEIFLDDITALADMMKADDRGSHVQFLRCRGEAHVGYAVDLAAGVKDGDMRKVTVKFLRSMA